MQTSMIDTYEVMYSSNKFPPRIWLKGGGKNLGQLLFMPNATATLPSDMQRPDGSVDLHYHLDDLSPTLDMLRNEKPMYCCGWVPAERTGSRQPPSPSELAKPRRPSSSARG